MCTTELGHAAIEHAEFTKRGVKLIALSCDSAEDHKGWIEDIKAANGGVVTYPIISDPKRDTAVLLGMLDEDEKDNAGIPATVRKVFVVGPDHKIKLQLIYPTAVGRNFAEIFRVIDALQLAARHPIATPVNWVKGGDVMIQPTGKGKIHSWHGFGSSVKVSYNPYPLYPSFPSFCPPFSLSSSSFRLPVCSFLAEALGGNFMLSRAPVCPLISHPPPYLLFLLLCLAFSRLAADADAEAKFPNFKRTAVPSGKGYIRFTPAPQ